MATSESESLPDTLPPPGEEDNFRSRESLSLLGEWPEEEALTLALEDAEGVMETSSGDSWVGPSQPRPRLSRARRRGMEGRREDRCPRSESSDMFLASPTQQNRSSSHSASSAFQAEQRSRSPSTDRSWPSGQQRLYRSVRPRASSMTWSQVFEGQDRPQAQEVHARYEAMPYQPEEDQSSREKLLASSEASSDEGVAPIKEETTVAEAGRVEDAVEQTRSRRTRRVLYRGGSSDHLEGGSRGPARARKPAAKRKRTPSTSSYRSLVTAHCPEHKSFVIQFFHHSFQFPLAYQEAAQT